MGSDAGTVVGGMVGSGAEVLEGIGGCVLVTGGVTVRAGRVVGVVLDETDGAGDSAVVVEASVTGGNPTVDVGNKIVVVVGSGTEVDVDDIGGRVVVEVVVVTRTVVVGAVVVLVVSGIVDVVLGTHVVVTSVVVVSGNVLVVVVVVVDGSVVVEVESLIIKFDVI